MPNDSPLAAFRHAYFGPIDQYLAWHDGFTADPASLNALSPAERLQAEAELLAALRAGHADARAILGLAHLRSRDALPLLHHCLRQNHYAQYALDAIARIDPTALDCPLLADTLNTATNTSHLIDLLMGLAQAFTLPQVGSAVASAALRRLTHPDYLVRYHALGALRRLYHLPAPGPKSSLAVLRADELFSLISRTCAPLAYRKAQRRLVAQVPPALLREFPLGLA